MDEAGISPPEVHEDDAKWGATGIDTPAFARAKQRLEEMKASGAY